MKKYIASLGLVLLMALPAGAEVNPLVGKIIALDAGHGGGEDGAPGYCEGVKVIEADLNLAVRAELAARLTLGGATVHNVEQVSSRQDRVADAEAAGSNVLISIHHNSSTNLLADYTQSFVTQKNDKVLASFVHPKIVSALDLPDKGIKSDGYGMTVYGSLPGILTESYFISNPDEACDFLNYKNNIDAGITGTHVQLEAQAMYDGLYAYFSQNTGGGGHGRK